MDQNLKTDAVTLTKTLATHLAAAQFADLPPAALREARRGVLDWIGCALAGSGHRTITTLIDVLAETGGRPQATVLGRNMKLGLLDAPLVNGQMGHLLDFDDTHMGGVVLHTSSPVLAALFALAERTAVSGADLMLAYAVGFEAGVRSGRTAPGHHRGGWHLTGTLGSIAAGAACGRLLGLDAQRLTYAMGIAATQAAGMQQNRGTMCKSFHAGKAAANGVLAALLAERGFDSSQEIIEGKRGFSRIYSDVAAPAQLTAGLGDSWLIETNGHKPYACGVVLHPLIDAVIALREHEHIDPAAVEEIALRLNPLVLTITGVVEPQSGLQSKFSFRHSAAVALADGTAGIAQYSDARAADPTVAGLRRKVTAVGDDTLRADEAYATVTAGGTRHEVHIPHASGTAANPMSDAAIEAKFIANATPAIGAERARRAAELVWSLDKLKDVRELIALLA
jgi:2-methylcitrate dehydratase PrpD